MFRYLINSSFLQGNRGYPGLKGDKGIYFFNEI